MSTVYFFCDESGAKGYADQGESFPGEVGVFAGILVPDSAIATAQPAFDAIAQKYTPTTGKLHIADLAPEQQQGLREDLYTAIRESQLPCFWYAIHSEGLHQFQLVEEQALKSAVLTMQATRVGTAPRVKMESLRADVRSMHVELFLGLYSHVLAFLLERDRHDVDLEIRTDQVDSPVVKRFEEVAQQMLDEDPNVQDVSGFDTVTKKVVRGSITTSVQWPEELKFSPVVKSLCITTVPQVDGLVLAADVLSNSLNFHFRQRGPGTLYRPLNELAAIVDHPLAEHLAAFKSWGAGDQFGDGLYSHPRSTP